MTMKSSARGLSAEPTNRPARLRPFAMCNGEGLQVCATCIRNLSNYREPPAMHQPMLSPTLASRGRCADWRTQ